MRTLSRRTLLHGAGASLALPWLEAMLPARVMSPPEGARITRWLTLYVPNGIHMPDWTPAAEGAEFDLPFLLEPLAPFREHLSVLSGLTHDKGRANGDGPGDHARAAATFLTGVQPLKTDGQVLLGRSADQVAAAELGHRTRLRSVELGCEAGRSSGECDSGYACAYSNNISWQSETVPAAKEIDPRLVFHRLFRGGDEDESSEAIAERLRRRRSILDFVRADSSRLRRYLSVEDRRKLDEFFDGIREVERRIEFEENAHVAEVPDSERPTGVPKDDGEHIRLMNDLLVLALQTDSTRIATFMLANEGSNKSYPKLEVREGHHSLSHHGGDEAKQAQIRTINRFHTEQLAHLLGRLAGVREGAGSLLDAVMLVYGSGLGDGNRHNHDDLPVLLIGGGNGALSPGRHLRFAAETPLNNLHLALLERLGAPTAALGDGTGVLEGI
ncbi:MAG: DUF1552 domain-containing protein [Planctomycetota bacterium]|jgi:hypothetical protein|nr:DUF1552 domain-containing protein [Planctomycetota bacterium]MDP6764229.1 DUF1552 domain-containing protein [Planctomycetota bacterium]MDP6988318.1 DUF1552 domain-containing protein [Planctomycetota bacterium]